MSRELSDPDHEVEVTLVNGDMVCGPNTRPEVWVRWVASLFLEPQRVIPDDCGGTYTGAELVERYLQPNRLRGISHGDMYAALARFR